MKKRFNKAYFVGHGAVLAVLTGIILLTGVFFLYTNKAKREGSEEIDTTLEFMKLQCLRYDNLVASGQTREEIQLLDKARELERCLEEKENPNDKEFLTEYAQNQRLSGVFLIDKDGNPIETVTLDAKTVDDWDFVIQDKNVVNVMEYPKKSYISYEEQEDGSVYHYAAIAMAGGEGFLFCYTRQIPTESDELQLGINNLFSGYQLEMDGLIMITDGEKILTSNNEDLQGTKITDYPLLTKHSGEISSDKVNMISQEGTRYLCGFSKSRNYYLYVFFPARAIFDRRSSVLAYVLFVYILLLLVIASVRQRELHHSNQLKMNFLRQMSHDIRTPINGIRGMVRIGDCYPDDMEKQKECREKIWEASDFLMDLVNDVLDMGKLESGEITLEEKPFHLKELTGSVVSVLENQAKDHGITLRTDQMEGEHWNLIGSPVHIRRILTNLVNNAIKYNQENGSITISCREMPQKEENQAIFEIVCADTGIGMSREFQKRMFDQFTQENAGGVSHHGTGLGLPIVKSLVEEMKGSIRCESEKGKGTVFYLTIPFLIDKAAKEPKIVTQEEYKEDLQGVSVLLVEDNELNMEIAEFILEEKGVHITKAWNGQEAVHIFEQSEPGTFQIILMDIQMPVMDGEKAAHMIRSLDRKDAKQIPIVAMTANAFEEDIQKATKAGMTAYLTKPIEPEQMIKVIYTQLSSAKNRKK